MGTQNRMVPRYLLHCNDFHFGPRHAFVELGTWQFLVVTLWPNEYLFSVGTTRVPAKG
jgi:hypothetical protein